MDQFIFSYNFIFRKIYLQLQRGLEQEAIQLFIIVKSFEFS